MPNPIIPAGACSEFISDIVMFDVKCNTNWDLCISPVGKKINVLYMPIYMHIYHNSLEFTLISTLNFLWWLWLL